jgi:hypothetical protein
MRFLSMKEKVGEWSGAPFTDLFEISNIRDG